MCISELDVIKQYGKVRKVVRWSVMISGGGVFVDICIEFSIVSIDMFSQCIDCEFYVLEILFIIYG